MTEVVFVSMPFVDLHRPSLALGLLKALLARDGIDSRVVYGNLRFAEKVGARRYEALNSAMVSSLIGEWVFSGSAFLGGTRDPKSVLDLFFGNDEEGMSTILRTKRRRALAFLPELQDQAEALVDELAREIVATRPRIVGCTSTFQQHVAALALLRRVKKLAPDMVTMIGGANCETRMGLTTHRRFPWVDFVVSGDADGLIVPLCRQVLEEGREIGAEAVPDGVLAPVHRRDGYPAGAPGGDGVPRAVFQAMDTLPDPDFSDYFEALDTLPIGPAIDVSLSAETSRGCWWGAASHCTFCGLNGGMMGFRSKSPERALAEIERLVEAHGVDSIDLVDNILDMKYFDSLIPELAHSDRQLRLFYETKSNLKRQQVHALAAAGVRCIQPGIESLHTRVLATIAKGVRASMNVLLLKWARESGVRLSWSLLWGFPGEEDAWYAEMAELIPLLSHLQPPHGVNKVRYDRYSPHFNQAEHYGLHLRPIAMMAEIYPLEDQDLFDQSYFFDDEAEKPVKRPGVDRLIAAVRKWRETQGEGPPLLRMKDEDGKLEIQDRRPCAVREKTVLTGLAREVYLACEEGAADRSLAAPLGRETGLAPLDGELSEVVGQLQQDRLMAYVDSRHIALAVPTSAPDWPYDPAKLISAGMNLKLAERLEARHKGGLAELMCA